ncbi:MAG: hypothetical protein MK236_08935, partial [Pedosphaera sp.]|nr:hypothetical protein [Pedosphaera sp.]
VKNCKAYPNLGRQGAQGLPRGGLESRWPVEVVLDLDVAIRQRFLQFSDALPAPQLKQIAFTAILIQRSSEDFHLNPTVLSNSP